MRVKLLNTFVNNVSMNEALVDIESLIASGKKSYLVAVNVDVITKIENDSYLRKITNNADMVLVDGKPLIWISKFHKRPIKEKISGSDLVPKLCEVAAQKGYTIYILGGKEGVAEKAKENLEAELPGIQIAGTSSPPFGFETDEEELTKINNMISEAHPDLLIVCFGCPKQEKFVYENYDKYNAKISICAGATVDFLAQNIKRAPKWMSRYGLEWFFRFTKEPTRLFRRYFIEDVKIVKLIWKYKM